MATFVLVHGGGHGGWCYQRLARLLRAEGHEVHCPTLTGLGERSHLLNPSINLDTHIEDVVQLLFHEDLHDVYLAGHSYGGMVITGVADRALGRVGHLVFLDAAQPQNGEALSDIAYTMMNAAYQGMRVVDGMEMVLFLDPEMDNLFGVTDPADVAWMHPRLKPHPWACFSQQLRLEREDQVARAAAHNHQLYRDPHPAPARIPPPRAGRRSCLRNRHRPRPDDHRAAQGRRHAARSGAARSGRNRLRILHLRA